MNLWMYLVGKMRVYGNRIAFPELNMTYSDILAFPTGKDIGKLRICEAKTRAEQAVEILKSIAAGTVSVPVTHEYGESRYQMICRTIDNDRDRYDDLAFILFTSGTTGEPKGIMLTHENVITNLEYILTYFQLSGAERICIGRPLVHSAVLVGELLYGLINGKSIYFYEEPFMPQRLAQYLRDNRIDVFCATPTVYNFLAETNAKLSIGICVISGERLVADMALKIASRFRQVKFYHVYGLTEHSPRVSALLPEEFTFKAGSIGKPIGQVQMKLESGELLVKSRCVMRGYYRTETENIKDGWLYTGDMAHTDRDGYYYIDGRKDELIIRAGVNIYPQEIENVVRSYAGIEECQAYGIADERFGQAIGLRYRGEVDEKHLRKYLTENLPPYLCPTKYESNYHFEYTPSGKTIRKKDEYQDGNIADRQSIGTQRKNKRM